MYLTNFYHPLPVRDCHDHAPSLSVSVRMHMTPPSSLRDPYQHLMKYFLGTYTEHLVPDSKWSYAFKINRVPTEYMCTEFWILNFNRRQVKWQYWYHFHSLHFALIGPVSYLLPYVSICQHFADPHPTCQHLMPPTSFLVHCRCTCMIL